MRKLIEKVVIFLEMIKVEHSVFALPFAYLGLILAENGRPSFKLFLWVSLAMISFRSMAMGLNRLIDLKIDSLNPRTSKRALPAKRLKVSFVWIITLVFFTIFEYCAYRLGWLCLVLSPIPVILAVLYPWTKRFTWLSHFVLGIILGIAPYGAWIASRGVLSWIPGFLMLGVTAWVTGFDIIYALQDVEFDRQYGLYSFPARFGSKVSLNLTKIVHIFALVFWGVAGRLAGCGAVYFVGLLVVGLFLLREHWLIRSFGIAKLEEAFFQMNAVVSVSIFVAAWIDISWRGILR